MHISKTLSAVFCLIIVFSANSYAESLTQKMSVTGDIFTHDTSMPALGKAYRDPSGLIWGDILKERGQVLAIDQITANHICRVIGARLPTREEFTQLAKYLGADSTSGYWSFAAGTREDILPGLSGHWFWSSSLNERHVGLIHGFDGEYGVISSAGIKHSTSARCVFGPRK